MLTVLHILLHKFYTVDSTEKVTNNYVALPMANIADACGGSALYRLPN